MATSLLTDAPQFASLTCPRFDTLAATSLSTILERQQALGAGLQPENYDEWQCNQETGVLRMVNRDGTGIEASVQILGSYAPESQSWEWAWNNPDIVGTVATASARVRAYGEEHDLAPLSTGIVRASEGESRGMIAVAAVIADVLGVFWAPSGQHTVAMGYRDVRRIATRSTPSGAAPARRDSAPHTVPASPSSTSAQRARARSANPVKWLAHMIQDPIVLKRSKPKPIGNRYVPLTAANEAFVAPELKEFLAHTEGSLLRRGFATPLRATNRVVSNVTSVVTLLEHPGDCCIAFVLLSITKTSGVNAVATFRTDFQDGVQLYTSNSAMVARTPPYGNTDAVNFPDVKSAGALYDIHRKRVADHTLRSAVMPLTRGTDPLAFADAEARTVQASWIAKGYFRRMSDDQMVFTWRGATLSAWRGLFPWLHLVERQRARKRADVVRHLGL